MSHDSYPDHHIHSILQNSKRIAMIGASNNPVRPSYFALKYLHERGYEMHPVNPGQAGNDTLGLTWHKSLADVPGPIDMVDVFRGSEHLPAILDEILALETLPKVLWMQLGVRHDDVAAKAESHGIKVVMNRCPKIEYGRLSGEIAWAGINSRTLSSRKPLVGGTQKLALGKVNPFGSNNRG